MKPPRREPSPVRRWPCLPLALGGPSPARSAPAARDRRARPRAPTARPPRPGPVKPNARLEATADEPAPEPGPPPAAGLPWSPTPDDFKGLRSVALIGLVSLAPAALLMFTSFLRINIVLVLLRQALGSPQVPGNQVLAALALLLSLLVMKPVGEAVYDAGHRPLRRRGDLAGPGLGGGLGTDQDVHVPADPPDQPRLLPPRPPRAGRALDRAEPDYAEDYPLRVVAPAFLLSELTTALMIGFVIYLPFLVIDLVVSAVLSAMGLFMLPAVAGRPAAEARPLRPGRRLAPGGHGALADLRRR